jgi:hypothetical protein
VTCNESTSPCSPNGLIAPAVRDQTTGDIDFARRAARFEAEGNGRKLHNDAFDQGVAGAAKGFDAAPNLDLPDRLTDLDADRAVGMCDDAFEFGGIHRSGIDVKAARALAECFDRRIHLKDIDAAEIDEADAAWTMRSYFVFCNLPVHNTPVVKHHVVRAVGRDRSAIAHAIRESPVNHEDAA